MLCIIPSFSLCYSTPHSTYLPLHSLLINTKLQSFSIRETWYLLVIFIEENRLCEYICKMERKIVYY